MDRKLRILQVCNKPPYPPQDGGAISMNNVTQGFIDQGHYIKVVAVNTPKHSVNIDDLPADYVENTHITLQFIDTSIKPWDAFVNLFSDKSYNVQRFVSDEFDYVLTDILLKEDFDIIQVESIFMMPYINTFRKYSDAKVVLRCPNVEHRIWERMAKTTKNPFKKAYLKLLAKRLKKYEINQLNKVDALYALTSTDEKSFIELGCNVPTSFVPTGVDMTKNIEVDYGTSEFPSLFHLGAMDWMPNIEGLNWFIKNVWPTLNNSFPELKLYLAGRRTPESWFKLNLSNIEVIGEVDDAAEFIKSKAIMIVPLLSGSGMRIKIIEGMMLGRPVVTTTVGAEGIEYTDKENIIIANTPHEFISTIKALVTNYNLSKEIGEKARKHISLVYNNQKIADKLESWFYELTQN